MKIPKIPRPSAKEVWKYQELWNTFENYHAHEGALRMLFDIFPRNQDTETVLLKIWALNNAYGTHIYDAYAMSKHIVSLNIVLQFAHDNIEIVERVANLPGKRRLLSFASKYASFHNPDVFPIYDYYVLKVLKHFRRTTKFADFKNKDLNDYVTFVQILHAFRKFFKIDEFSLKQTDRYIWLLGKKFFPRKYGKKKATA